MRQDHSNASCHVFTSERCRAVCDGQWKWALCVVGTGRRGLTVVMYLCTHCVESVQWCFKFIWRLVLEETSKRSGIDFARMVLGIEAGPGDSDKWLSAHRVPVDSTHPHPANPSSEAQYQTTVTNPRASPSIQRLTSCMRLYHNANAFARSKPSRLSGEGDRRPWDEMFRNGVQV